MGERLRLDEDPAALLSDVRPAALTIDVVGCGGLTRAVQITAAARQHGVPVYPHGRSMVPGIHLAAAFPDSIPAVEYRCQWEPRRQLLYRRAVDPRPWLPSCAGLRRTRHRTTEIAMTRTGKSITVRGTSRHDATGLLLVLDEHLEGHDTFLTGHLDLGEETVPVRIISLDDVSVLRPGRPVEMPTPQLDRRPSPAARAPHASGPRRSRRGGSPERGGTWIGSTPPNSATPSRSSVRPPRPRSGRPASRPSCRHSHR